MNLIGQEQNTVGLLQINSAKSFPGYNLIYPNHQSSVFLLDQCGQVINEWVDNVTSAPGTVAKLTPQGNLLRAKSSGEFDTPSFGAGGSGGVIEILDWESNVLARRVIRDSIYRQHHDLALLPNGNVMCIVYERKFLDDIIEAGFDILNNNQTELWFDCIFEFTPDLDSVVWEWHSWDHLIQEIDSSKNNFGVIKDHPEKINFNYQEFAFGRQDFMHCNAIDYNEDLDQVVLSARNFQEVWIIDHSTTSEEARGSVGGQSNKGGDLIYRWGNPIVYHAGEVEDQRLIYQHDSKWVKDKDSKYFGHLLIFNNKIGDKISVGELVLPVFDSINYSYSIGSGNYYLPEQSTREISHPDSLKNDSTHASNIRLLGNGNFLICAAGQGRLFEVTDDEEPVWEYKVPLIFGEPVQQGATIGLSQNFTNQVERYPLDFLGFDGKDLTPKGYLEINPNEDFCQLTHVNELEELNPEIVILINPVENLLEVKSTTKEILYIINYKGEVVLRSNVDDGFNSIDISNLNSGVYFLSNESNRFIEKFIKL